MFKFRELMVCRLTLIVSTLVYPLWGFYPYYKKLPFYDPLLQRILVGVLMLVLFVKSLLSETCRKYIKPITFAAVMVMTSHYYFLMFKNPNLMVYQNGLFLMLITINLGLLFLPLRYFVTYAIFNLVGSFALAIFNEFTTEYFALFANTTAFSLMIFALIYNTRKIENLLVEKDEIQQAVFENTPLMMFILDQNRTVQRANKYALQSLNCTFENVKNKRISHVLGCKYSANSTGPKCEETDNCVDCSLKNAILCSASSGNKILKFEASITKSDSKESHYNLSTIPVSLEKEKFLLVCIEDITEKRQLQTQIFQSAKLASIGLLASGIAHEINNPLAIIQSSIDNLSDHLEENGVVDNFINTSIDRKKRSINRIVGIISGLRAFARANKDSEIEVIDVNTSINNTINLVEHIYQKEGIKFIKEFTTESTLSLGWSSSFQQVVMDFLANSREALENSQTKKIKISTKLENDKIKIIFEDTGCGIKKENLDKIFDTFFSTKPMGKSTGLGLSIAHSIIASMQGKIDVASEPGSGSTFTITLPVHLEN